MNPIDALELRALELSGSIDTAKKAGDICRNLVAMGMFTEDDIAGWQFYIHDTDKGWRK